MKELEGVGWAGLDSRKGGGEIPQGGAVVEGPVEEGGLVRERTSSSRKTRRQD